MQAIALEFEHRNGALAANGTDVVMHLDGRWKNSTRVDAIWAKIEELRSGPFASRYEYQHFVGFTRLGVGYQGKMPQVRMSDPSPPWWVERDPGSKF
jgi:hypothetical protein